MAKVEIKLNPKGIMSLFKSPPVVSWLQDVGDSVAGTASGMAQEDRAEYSARAHVADRTAIVNIYPDSEEAAHDNYENNTLLKALSQSGLPRTKPHLR